MKDKYIENTRPYIDGEKLSDTEHLVSVEEYDRSEERMGFLTKPRKTDNEIPASLIKWSGKNEIRVIDEDYRSGWSVFSFRAGMSQSWVVVKHPLGFLLEIYASNFISLVRGTGPINIPDIEPVNIINSEFQGEFRWYRNTLIRK